MVNAWQMFGLGLDYVLATIAVFIFLYFIKKISEVRNTTKEFFPFLGLAILALFIGIAMMISSWFDYYRWNYDIEIYPLYKLYTLSILLSLLGSSFFIEYVLKKTKYAITVYMIIGFILIMFINDFDQLNTMILYFAAPAILFFILLYYYTFLRPTSGYLRNRMISVMIGFIFMAFTMVLRNDIFVTMLGDPLFSIATSFGITGMSLIFYGFSAFSTFTDIKWQEKSRELYVILESGICLYAFSFEKNDYLEDSNLIAGGFSGITSLLSEMVRTDENLKIIDYQNVKIILEQIEGIIFILVLKEESPFLSYKLKNFSLEFMNYYGVILKDWDHDVSRFYPTKTLIDKIFETKGNR